MGLFDSSEHGDCFSDGLIVPFRDCVIVVGPDTKSLEIVLEARGWACSTPLIMASHSKLVSLSLSVIA